MGYPLPCVGCNMIAQDENIAYECFERDGWLKDGKMVIHFPDCPFGPDAYPRVSARRAARAESKAALDVAMMSIKLQAKPRGPFEILAKFICDLFGL